ncbi:glycoside hydrolase family 127 protein [Bosea sp. F3-2]|uniref:glycoside hydrolase family 127 protein n=1 Tax=Bosea sp. F3-2 TaxID=2599640 RepID=UPI0011EEE2A2|nr:beta-L-arabinofuranosidase domain-containing protein [Bosea sp. F3-2]QEL26473.1 glycoside hydrolase family 127 protein [Bosea sp. F3-2]
MTSHHQPKASVFRPPAVPDVEMRGFWGERIDAIVDRTVMILYDRCVVAGMLDQIDPTRPVPEVKMPWHTRADGTPDTVNVQMFWDSDVAKVIETAAYALYRKPNSDLKAKMDAIIDMFAGLQQPDGYMNSWFVRMQPGQRWTNLRDCHELYCAGHLMEAAVAYFHATGKRKLLDVMCRYADHIDATFGPNPGQRPGYCGHEEIELALVRLGRTTGEQRYLDLARYFVDQRGQQPNYFDVEAAERGVDPTQWRHKTYLYNQSHLPVREQTKVVGHAVRAMYLYSGMADVATEFGDDSLTDALKVLWEDLTSKQMYVTGGIGPAASNEGFTEYYDLPNESAYAETCAAVALMMWASRMLGRGPDRHYADIMEQALYNGALSGLSIDGSRFFYDNPLESSGGHHRWIWHRCPCCPPNIARTVTAIGSYMYGVSSDGIALHLYGASTARLKIGTTTVNLTQDTRYPTDGRVAMSIGLESPSHFTLSLRVPGWCENAALSLNGQAVKPDEVRGGYFHLKRNWQDGDRLELDLPMDVRALYAHPAVKADLGRVAIARGPLIYCTEEVDNGADLNALIVPDDLSGAKTVPLPELNNTVAIEIPARREQWPRRNGKLYDPHKPDHIEATARLVPYHLWDNREPGEMLVWVRAGAGQ